MPESNYVPNLGEFLELPSLTIRQLYTGTGAPTGSAAEGSIYISNTGAIYEIQGGVWTLISSGGGSGAGLSGSGSPEGVQTANPGTTYWDATAKSFYIKDTGTGNTGWGLLL